MDATLYRSRLETYDCGCTHRVTTFKEDDGEVSTSYQLVSACDEHVRVSS